MHLGLDSGGTNIACGVVDDNFKILAKASILWTLQKETQDNS